MSWSVYQPCQVDGRWFTGTIGVALGPTVQSRASVNMPFKTSLVVVVDNSRLDCFRGCGRGRRVPRFHPTRHLILFILLAAEIALASHMKLQATAISCR